MCFILRELYSALSDILQKHAGIRKKKKTLIRIQPDNLINPPARVFDLGISKSERLWRTVTELDGSVFS